MADAEQIAGEARLHRAVRALSAQSGTPVEQIIDWLCNGGLAQMALSHFAAQASGELDGTPYLGRYATAGDGVTVTTHDADPAGVGVPVPDHGLRWNDRFMEVLTAIHGPVDPGVNDSARLAFAQTISEIERANGVGGRSE